jgi:mono/diheme cytochrome c family protein/glucose/arabinose dehydrogenase
MTNRTILALILSAVSLTLVRAQAPTTPVYSKAPGNIWPPERKATPTSPALSPQDELRTFSLPPGFHAELVAAEPLVDSPIVVDFDPDGRLWVLETPAFLPDLSGRDSREPINRVVVLEDTDGDGKMDKRTVFAEGLVMPRALKVLDHGVLVGEPPNLWLMKDTNGDLKADTKELVNNTYGRADAGIEHNANGLFWAMDNTMYTSEHTWNLRLRNGTFDILPSLSRGQWQISQDDAGRIYRNVNDSPLYVDYTPVQYYLRNANAVRTRGLYELLIEQMDATVYPVRPTRGVNRGYRDEYFRADGSSIVIQGAGTPVVYRGDRYPKELQGNVFITDSPTNLVHRFVITDDGSGRLSAKNGYPRGEFIASSDERFRPVNLFSAPDGTMYVVDMYRGVVQAGGIWTEYLTDYIKSHELQLPVQKGRIWRIVYGTGANRRGPKPSLGSATPAQLVQTLSHPNGWWRDTAQRLLVERGETSVTPALKSLAGTASDWRTKLQALWTLDGLDAIDQTTVQNALGDQSPDVRAAAVRLSERWLSESGQPIAAAVLKLIDDKSWTVRRQVAASIGAMPQAARVDPATTLLTREGTDPVLVDTLVGGLNGVEGDVLAKVLQAPATANAPADGVAMLTAAVAKSADAAAVQRAVDIASDPSQPAWQRKAILQGLDAGLPAPGAAGGGGGRGGRGGGGGGGGLPGLSAPGARAAMVPGRGVTLAAEPAKLTAMASGSDDLAAPARTVVAKLGWTGKPAPVAPPVAPLTADEQKRFDAGKEIFLNVCAGCHQADGQGKEKVAPNLVTSKYVQANPQVVIRIVVGGKEGPVGLMPPLAGTLSDAQLAAALTYIRREWGHTASPISEIDVRELRQSTTTHKGPWTEAELSGMLAGGGRGRGGNQ